MSDDADIDDDAHSTCEKRNSESGAIASRAAHMWQQAVIMVRLAVRQQRW
jgi:hypothetical protein